MPLYLCSVCGCYDSSGLTYYWSRKADGLPAWCSACDPGMKCWHRQWEQESAVGMLIDTRGFLWHPWELMHLATRGLEIVGIVQE